VVASIENRKNVESLADRYGPGPRSLASMLAWLIAIFGMAAFVLVLFRQ